MNKLSTLMKFTRLMQNAVKTHSKAELCTSFSDRHITFCYTFPMIPIINCYHKMKNKNTLRHFIPGRVRHALGESTTLDETYCMLKHMLAL
jgi:hypothetical protein